MIYIYTEPNNMKFINDVESHFKGLSRLNLFTDEIYTEIMKKIDKISYRKGNFIQTPFGETHIDNISTGCKAVCLAYYYHNQKNILINISECGNNALDVLFNLNNSLNYYLYINRGFNLEKLSYFCYINNIFVNGSFNIYMRLVSLSGNS